MTLVARQVHFFEHILSVEPHLFLGVGCSSIDHENALQVILKAAHGRSNFDFIVWLSLLLGAANDLVEDSNVRTQLVKQFGILLAAYPIAHRVKWLLADFKRVELGNKADQSAVRLVQIIGIIVVKIQRPALILKCNFQSVFVVLADHLLAHITLELRSVWEVVDKFEAFRAIISKVDH